MRLGATFFELAALFLNPNFFYLFLDNFNNKVTHYSAYTNSTKNILMRLGTKTSAPEGSVRLLLTKQPTHSFTFVYTVSHLNSCRGLWQSE